jgi:hypothetical protein
MAAARGRIGSFKHRLFVPRPMTGPIAEDRLRAAVLAGLEDQVEHLSGPSESFSLPAWRRWARLMTDRRHAKGWPSVFATGRGLFGALLSVAEEVDGGIGASGGHLRHLYAAFLDEAAPIVDLPRLAVAASAWRQAADKWDALAEAAVPGALPDARAAVEAGRALHDAVLDGEAGRSRALVTARALWAVRERHAEAFPLPADAIDALFADIGQRLGELYEAERAALAVTARAIGR